MTERIKVAVMGTGSIGSRHLSLLKGLKGVQPIAVPKRVERLSELENQGFPVAKDIRTAAQKGATHCIVASDTAQHIQDALEALQYNLILFVEKPLGVEARGCQHLLEAAKKKNQKICVGCVMRFSRSLNRFREVLKEIGSVHQVHVACQSYLPSWRPKRDYRQSYSARAEEGGVLRDLIHEIDYACWLFGWPKSIWAHLKNTNQLGIQAEEVAELFWKTESVASVSVYLDYLSRVPKRAMRALGTKGNLEWDGIQGTVTLERTGKPKETAHLPEGENDKYLAELQSFLDPTKNSQITTGKEAIRALSLCDAARLSSQSHQEEPIDYLA